MPDLSELLKSIPVADIAKQLGIPEDVADSAIKQVIPGLVGGLAANASDSSGAASLEKALAKHQGRSTNVADIDTDDGEKIVNNVFGVRKKEVVEAVATKSTATQDIIAKVLPIVAPIVLAWVASQFFGGKSDDKASGKTAAPATEGGLGGLLGGLLSSQGGQDAIGGLLGGLLGGGKK